ncbi:MAG: hypothetical protein ACT4O3_04885, partial [Elusimicrobiota bacterium]
KVLRGRCRTLSYDVKEKTLWALFSGASVLSFIRGAAAFPLLYVVRDSALYYYSFFAHTARIVLQDSGRVRTLGIVLALALLAKSSLSVFGLMGGGANALYISCLLAVSLLSMPLWEKKHRWWFVVIAFMFALLLHGRVRSSWVAFAAFGLAFPLAAAFYGFGRRRCVKALLALAAGACLLFVLPEESFQRKMRSRLAWVPFVGKGAMEGPLGSERPSGAHQDHFPTDVKSNSIGTGASFRPLKQSRLVFYEFQTFFQGLASPNLLTRVYFWLDAVEEVFGIDSGLFVENRRDSGSMSPDFRDYLTSRIGKFQLSNEIEGRWASFGVNSQTLRIFAGVPFGHKFVPSRLFWWMLETTRYDPHNSHIAVLYRTGLIGFLSYAGILALSFVRGARLAFYAGDTEDRWVLLSLLGGLLVHVVHSMTDVTLENAYKGMFFWVFLGAVGACSKRSAAIEGRSA